MQPFIKIAGVFLFIVAIAVSSCQKNYEFVVADTSGMRWFKGNTHAHTTMSDGDSPPEVVAQWYKDHGYHFLVLSDHNVFTDPAALQNLVDSTFLLIPGEELTSRFRDKAVHVNGLNIPGVIPAQFDCTLVATIQKNVDAVRAVGAAPHINHPNYKWSFNHETLVKIENNNLIEIFNGHPFVNNFGGGGWPGMEEVWDHLLTRGKRIYGIAVDDAHHFQGEFAPGRSNPGRGWVVVRAHALAPLEIVQNLEAGLFYASTGVMLDDMVVEPKKLAIHIQQVRDVRSRTEFIGAGGRLLLRTEENPAVYHLTKEELYVRAKITDSAGRVAWIQPVFVSSK